MPDTENHRTRAQSDRIHKMGPWMWVRRISLGVCVLSLLGKFWIWWQMDSLTITELASSLETSLIFTKLIAVAAVPLLISSFRMRYLERKYRVTN